MCPHRSRAKNAASTMEKEVSKLLIHTMLCLTSACSHRNRHKNTAIWTGNLRAEQARHRSAGPSMVSRPFTSQQTLQVSRPFTGQQARHQSEAVPEPRMLPLLWAITPQFAWRPRDLSKLLTSLKPCLPYACSDSDRPKTPSSQWRT